MSDFDEFDNPNPTNPEPEGFDDAFSSMESTLNEVPQGDWIQLRNGANRPVFVPLFEGETGISIAQAVGRAGLTVGVVQYYLDNNVVMADTVVPVGGIVEIIGNVKGGK